MYRTAAVSYATDCFLCVPHKSINEQTLFGNDPWKSVLSLQGHGGGVAFVLKKMDTILGKSSELMLGDLAVSSHGSPKDVKEGAPFVHLCTS